MEELLLGPTWHLRVVVYRHPQNNKGPLILLLAKDPKARLSRRMLQ